MLGFDVEDLSGGDSLVVDDKVIGKHPNPDRDVRSTYVQKTGRGGYRLAVREDDRGWRGDTYTVFALPDKMSVAEATVSASSSMRPLETLASGQWRPPLVFQREDSTRLWFMMLGQPYEVMGSWSVHAVADEGLRPLCSIEFLPSGNRVPFSLLPQAVRELEHLLNRTIGSGSNEGTLQPTARIRAEVQQTWGNIALRPWALREPYNFREAVDAGLSTWADISTGNRRLLQDIRRQYPLAEAALARYFQQHFGRTPADSRKSAAYAMDIALRMHFVFHDESPRGDDDKSRPPNPWRAGS